VYVTFKHKLLVFFHSIVHLQILKLTNLNGWLISGMINRGGGNAQEKEAGIYRVYRKRAVQMP
jgi:hypothetical protein